MADYPLGSYVWWRTSVRTPAWLDDEYGKRWRRRHPVYRFWCWARSVGLIQLRLSADGVTGLGDHYDERRHGAPIRPRRNRRGGGA